MMRKKFSIFLLISIIVSSIFFVHPGIKTKAEECNDCNQISTEPGDADYSQIICECTGAIPTIVASSDEIEPGQSITLHVDSGGLACPPYTWEVAETGYTIDSISNNDLETVTLTSQDGTCGVEYSNSNIIATVTVTDNCGTEVTTEVRNTSGHWSTWTTICQSSGSTGIFNRIYGYPIGSKYRYQIQRLNGDDNGLPCTESCAAYVLDGDFGFPNENGAGAFCLYYPGGSWGPAGYYLYLYDQGSMFEEIRFKRSIWECD